MTPVTISQTGVGNSAATKVDTFIAPFNIGFGVVVTGTVTYTVQHSFDGTDWFNHPDVAAETANADGNYAFPVLLIRLTVNSGSGTATLTAIQAGLVGG